MSTTNQSLQSARNTLLKELVKNSPKKYTAVLVSDDEDPQNGRKAILVPQKDLENDKQKERKHHHHHHHHSSHHSKGNVQPVYVISPRKMSNSEAYHIAKQAQLEAKLQKNAEKLARARADEQRRIEAEAVARARAQIERERKQRIRRILDETKRRQKEQRRCVTVFYTPQESDSDSSCSYESSDDSLFSSTSYSESSDDQIAEELEKLQNLAGKIEKAGRKIKTMASTTLSPKKHH